MAFRKSSDARPQILEVSPEAAIPGGEFRIRGKNFAGTAWPHVRFGELAAPLVIGSDSFLIVKVPEGADASEVSVGQDHQTSASRPCGIGVQIAEGLHPVANPVIDRQGNIYTTFSGSPGQKTSASIYKVERNSPAMPFVADLMNATGLALDQDDALFASSRHDSMVYRVSADGTFAVFVEGMGVATGIKQTK